MEEVNLDLYKIFDHDSVEHNEASPSVELDESEGEVISIEGHPTTTDPSTVPLGSPEPGEKIENSTGYVLTESETSHSPE